MSFFDSVQNAMSKVLPDKKPSLPMAASAGIGSGGAVPFDDDTEGYLVFLLFIPILWTIWIWMIVSKPAIIFYGSQVFFNFLAMCCFASVASFQAKWHVGPSGLTGFAVFVSVSGIFYSTFLLLTPVIYEKYDKLARLARALKEVRVSFILVGAGTVMTLLIAFITTISAWTEPGCKNASKDPHASLGETFQKGLSGWCSTKKAGAVFFWFTFGFWCASFTLTFLDWRNGKTTRPRDPPFTHPTEQSEVDYHAEEYDDGSSTYHGADPVKSESDSPFSDSHRYSSATSTDAYSSVPSYIPTSANPPVLPRPSIDAYGAFSDPAPSGFAPPAASASPAGDAPRISRTMQYADPYAAVRATVTANRTSSASPPSGPPQTGYTSYGGYP